MKHTVLLLLVLLLSGTLYAQRRGIEGALIDKETGRPIPGANVMLRQQNIFAVSGPNGDFRIFDPAVGKDLLSVTAPGYSSLELQVDVQENGMTDMGKLFMAPDISPYQNDEAGIITFDESQLEDDSGNSQSIGNLSGASDDVYLRNASYAFGATRFRVRGYDSEYYRTYINGVNFNDPARGSFNYSMLGGMNTAFRNKVITNSLEPATFSFGGLAGSTNIITKASEYAPGIRIGTAYTNRNYNWRGMVTYSTGITPSGWALVASVIARYAHEGAIDGTFYHSYGYFLSAEKILDEYRSLTITTFGAPTQRGQAAASYEECYDLTGNKLYNPNWGYQNGKKRNARVVDSFDPALVISYEWKPKRGTTFNAGFGFRYSNYASTALNWYNAPDPRPDYYRNLPSYYTDPLVSQLYTDLWKNDPAFSQINWDRMYEVNNLNNWENANKGTDLGSTYIVEQRHSNQVNFMLNSSLNTRLSDILTLQGGVGLKYTNASYYKTIDDLLGGAFWLDVDQYAERDFPDNPDALQNNLNNPNFRATEGSTFGYDYQIRNFQADMWLQNNINLSHWDINYAATASYSQFMRHGNMRNGRAPENSYGDGSTHRYVNFGVKAGTTYKLNGRNFFMVNAMYETRAPHFGYAYLSPKIKDDLIPNLKSERILSADVTYRFAYRNLLGRITAFQSNFYDQTELTSFYHDQYQTLVNYILTGVRKTYKGVELGVAYKVIPDVTLSFVGTIARYQYKNQPTGITNYENGSLPDTAQVVYLKNFNVGGTPQQAFNVGINWSAPKLWFFDLNLCYFNRSYVDLSPVRRTAAAVAFPWEGSTAQEIEQNYRTKATEITRQDQLNGGFMLNASIGKLLYIQRKYALNFNVSISNILNNRNIQSGGYEQGRFDFTNFDVNKYPNKYYYAQGINVFVNVGFRF